MVKWVLPFYLFAFLPFSASAQDEPQAPAVKFGYLSYDAAFKAMPEYATMQEAVKQLREKYEAEQKRVENDFNKKYEEFLDGQKSFPKTILQKRQVELQEMLDKNIAFKKESSRLLAEAEDQAAAPLKTRLAETLAKIGQERGFAFILNTDVNAVPWLNVTMGEDITEAVKELLK
jgi:outer membrane protein